MRKRKAPKNTYWRGDTLWARIKIKGRLVRFSLRTGDADLAATRVKAERERAIAAAHYGDDRKRYEDVVTAWAEHFVAHAVAPATAVRYAVSLRQLEPHLLGCYLDEVDRARLRAIVDARRTAGATTATIRRDLTALSSVLEYAIDQEWMDEDTNPALARLKRLSERRDPIVLPDQADIDRVIKAAPPALKPLIVAALKTGCRISELATAERSGLDHARRQLTVRGKGNKTRVIDLDYDDGYEALRAIPPRLGCRWLFWHGAGEPFRAASKHFSELVRWVYGEAQKEAQAAGQAEPSFRRFRFHDLRHLHAVRWLKSGGSIYELQQRLGHTSIRATEIYLAHLTPEEAKRAKSGAAGAQKESQGKRFGV